MYKEPKLEFYGTFRELTRIGTNLVDDGTPIGGNTGDNGVRVCITDANGVVTCVSL